MVLSETVDSVQKMILRIFFVKASLLRLKNMERVQKYGPVTWTAFRWPWSRHGLLCVNHAFKYQGQSSCKVVCSHIYSLIPEYYVLCNSVLYTTVFRLNIIDTSTSWISLYSVFDVKLAFSSFFFFLIHSWWFYATRQVLRSRPAGLACLFQRSWASQHEGAEALWDPSARSTRAFAFLEGIALISVVVDDGSAAQITCRRKRTWLKPQENKFI